MIFCTDCLAKKYRFRCSLGLGTIYSRDNGKYGQISSEAHCLNWRSITSKGNAKERFIFNRHVRRKVIGCLMERLRVMVDAEAKCGQLWSKFTAQVTNIHRTALNIEWGREDTSRQENVVNVHNIQSTREPQLIWIYWFRVSLAVSCHIPMGHFLWRRISWLDRN